MWDEVSPFALGWLVNCLPACPLQWVSGQSVQSGMFHK